MNNSTGDIFATIINLASGILVIATLIYLSDILFKLGGM